MAANTGWYGDWYATGWFPSVWFAPADESHLTPEETAQGGGRGSKGKKSKRVYLRRKDNILVFETPEQAQAYVEAEAKLEQKIPVTGTRKKRKKKQQAAARMLPAPVESVPISFVWSSVQQFRAASDDYSLIDQFNIDALMAIYQKAIENRLELIRLQDEDDIETILLLEA